MVCFPIFPGPQVLRRDCFQYFQNPRFSEWFVFQGSVPVLAVGMDEMPASLAGPETGLFGEMPNIVNLRVYVEAVNSSSIWHCGVCVAPIFGGGFETQA